MTISEPTAQPKTPEQTAEYFYEKWENTYNQLGQQINTTNAAYTERARLVALLAALYPSTWNFGDETEPDWTVVYVQLPTGQASWHVRESDMGLFEHVRRDDTTAWDGHTTSEKYERIAALAKQRAAVHPRGFCATCGHHLALRVDGTVRHHRKQLPGGIRGLTTCPGSGKHPKRTEEDR